MATLHSSSEAESRWTTTDCEQRWIIKFALLPLKVLRPVLVAVMGQFVTRGPIKTADARRIKGGGVGSYRMDDCVVFGTRASFL